MTPGGNKTRPQRSREGVAGATLPSWIVKVKSHIREQIVWLLEPWSLKLSCLFHFNHVTRAVRSLFNSEVSGCASASFLTEALAKVCLFVDEDFGRNHVSERHEHLENVLVSELLRQVVDEQVGTFRTWRSGRGGFQVRASTPLDWSPPHSCGMLHVKAFDSTLLLPFSLRFYIYSDSWALGHGFQPPPSL